MYWYLTLNNTCISSKYSAYFRATFFRTIWDILKISELFFGCLYFWNLNALIFRGSCCIWKNDFMSMVATVLRMVSLKPIEWKDVMLLDPANDIASNIYWITYGIISCSRSVNNFFMITLRNWVYILFSVCVSDSFLSVISII